MTQAAEAASTRHVTVGLLPFTVAIFLGFLSVGIPLPVLPAFVHDALHFGPVVVGAAIGVQPLTTLLTRQLRGPALRHAPTEVRGALRLLRCLRGRSLLPPRLRG